MAPLTIRPRQSGRRMAASVAVLAPCQMRYPYQGRDPNSGGDDNSLPWRLALLTQANSTY